MQSNINRWAIGIFGFVFLFGFVGVALDGGRSLKEEKKPMDPVYQHGFQVGYTLAKSGMVKPSPAEIDAAARQAALELRESGGMGFKMQWKSGFDSGWRAGD